ncbi:transposable element Tcb2 transposase [Trichonephila clavipes]|nr:transposable element Tcb2 transposase [Trichonephila clavipes]
MIAHLPTEGPFPPDPETCIHYGVDKIAPAAGRHSVLLTRWIGRSVPLEIVGSNGHEKVCGNPRAENRIWVTRKTTRREDRRIVRQALVDPTVTRSTIRADVGLAIVPQTISRHLAGANLKSKRPFRALPLTPEHGQLRLRWCQARSMWNGTDIGKKVVFSDESRFVLGTDDNCVRLWRRPGERYNSPHTILRHTARWCNGQGAIDYDSWSTLIVMRGTLTGQRYVDDILRPHVGPFVYGLKGQFYSKIMLVRIQQELLKTTYVIFRLFHGRPAAPICPL